MRISHHAVFRLLLSSFLLVAPSALCSGQGEPSLGQEPQTAPEGTAQPGVREFGEARANEAREQARQHMEHARARMEAMRRPGRLGIGPQSFGAPGQGPPGFVPPGFGGPGFGPAGPGLPTGELVSGTRVRLLPPPGFVLSDEFFGLKHAETGSRVVVSEIPVPLAETPPADDAAYAKRGVTILDRQNVKVAGQDGVLLESKQTMAGEVVRKWILFFGDDRRTVMLVAAYRAGQEQMFREALRFCLLNAQLDPHAKIDPAAEVKLRGEATGDRAQPKKPRADAAGPAGDAASAAPTKSSSCALAGTRVSLTPPPGFIPATAFQGYQQESTGSSIVIYELPGPISEFMSSTAADLAQRGMTLKQRKEVKVAGFDGVLIAATQETGGHLFNKWLLLVGDEKLTISITANFPQQHKELVGPLRTSLLGATFDRQRQVDPFADADFSLTLASGFKPAGRLQNVLLFVLDGVDPKQPMAVLVTGKSPRVQPQGSDRQQFAASHLEDNHTLGEVTIESTKPITIDGLEGFETLATAKVKEANITVFLYLTVLFEAKGQDYYLMQAQTGLAQRDAVATPLQEMARSFKRKR